MLQESVAVDVAPDVAGHEGVFLHAGVHLKSFELVEDTHGPVAVVDVAASHTGATHVQVVLDDFQLGTLVSFGQRSYFLAWSPFGNPQCDIVHQCLVLLLSRNSSFLPNRLLPLFHANQNEQWHFLIDWTAIDDFLQ